MKFYGDLDVCSAKIFEDDIELKGLQYAVNDGSLLNEQDDDHEVVYTLHDKKLNIYDGKNWKKFQTTNLTAYNELIVDYSTRLLTDSDHRKTFSNENSSNHIVYILPNSNNLKNGIYYTFIRKSPNITYIAINTETSDDTVDGYKFLKCTKTGLDGSITLMYLGFGKWISITKYGQWLYSKSPSVMIWVGDRALFMGGSNGSDSSLGSIEAVTISTTANASYFGEMSNDSDYTSDACSNGYSARGILCRGNGNSYNEFFTITIPNSSASLGVNLTYNNGWSTAMGSNGMLGSGLVGPGSATIQQNWFKFYNPVATYGVFGHGYINQFGMANSASNGVLGRIVHISGISARNIMSYHNINAGYSSAIFFGSITSVLVGDNNYLAAGCSNGINNRAIIAAWNLVDYITITTPSNSTQFGELVNDRRWVRSTSNGTKKVVQVCY